MLRMLSKKTLLCGFVKSTKLVDNLEHYKTCQHEDCKKRAASWAVIVKKFQAGKPQHGEQFQ